MAIPGMKNDGDAQTSNSVDKVPMFHANKWPIVWHQVNSDAGMESVAFRYILQETVKQYSVKKAKGWGK